MGTNFYCRHIPTESEQMKLTDLLKARQYDDLKEQLDALVQPYHIGKRSYGWQFLFQASDEKEHPNDRICWEAESLVPWEATKESLMEYLQRDDIEIYDEYGDRFTFDQFWNEQVGDSLYNDEKHINLEQYRKKNPPCYDIQSHDFERDGLRFSYVWFS